MLAGTAVIVGSLLAPLEVGASGETQISSNAVHKAPSHSQLTLYPGDRAISLDSRYHLIHQRDGNVVLYGPNGAIWSTATTGRSTSHLVFQGDGNFVLYGEGRALWHTATHGSGNALAVQNDANLVIYNGSRAVWAIKGMAPATPTGGVEGAITHYFGGPNTRLGAEARRIARCESKMNPNAKSPTNDHGLFQINKPSHYSNFGRVTGSPFYNGVYDPYENAEYARDLYNRQGWGPWTCRKAL